MLKLFFILVTIISVFLSRTANSKSVLQISETEIYRQVAPGGIYQLGYRSAVFEKDGHKWTIMGANAPIVTPTVYPKVWPVDSAYEVLVIPEPITNYKILPYTEPIQNAVKANRIIVNGMPDSYEPASFVIRSGSKALKDVMIAVDDLHLEGNETGEYVGESAILESRDIDVRVVQCWYQAGKELTDLNHKKLTPELLLHDDGLVYCDHNNQVNIIRDFDRLSDCRTLQPFDVPAKQNKQIWVTVHITENLIPGKYVGGLSIIIGGLPKRHLDIEVNVLPYQLPDPELEYVLYYESNFQQKNQFSYRTKETMRNELEDLKKHGLTNATVWHRVSEDEALQKNDWQILRDMLQLRREIGWGKKPLLYLDWRQTLSGDLNAYKNKILKIIAIAREFGIDEVYIYGQDEVGGKELLSFRERYRTVHEAGAKNFVACGIDYLDYIPELIDLPILPGNINLNTVKQVQGHKQITAWNYANPQCGVEEPETYRMNYGIKLAKNGFSGVCDYVYQQQWYDFGGKKYRSHTMAYPTLTTPIPTIQWEGWRAGVNDIRYLTLLKNEDLMKYVFKDPVKMEPISVFRKMAINVLIEKGKRK